VLFVSQRNVPMIDVLRTSPRAASLELDAPPLAADAQVDACILDAGVAGMTLAYLLAREGRSVLVLAEGPVGGGRTDLECAPWTTLAPARYAERAATHGSPAAWRAAQSERLAVDALETIVRRERIACDFQRVPGCHLARSESSRHSLVAEYMAARMAALEDAELLEDSPIAGFEALACLRTQGHARFDPLRYLAGLGRAIARHGGRLHSGGRVRAIEPGRPGRVESSAGHAVEAGVIVAPAHLVPSSAPGSHDAGLPNVVHAVGVRVPRGSVAQGVYREVEPPACTLWLQSRGATASDVLVACSEERPVNLAEDSDVRHLALEQWVRSRLPRAGEVVARATWEVMPISDCWALAGQDRCDNEGLYVPLRDTGPPAIAALVASLVLKDFVDASVPLCDEPPAQPWKRGSSGGARIPA
jgi:glycine/D-amino acid oxidase-like deaminating enzyme